MVHNMNSPVRFKFIEAMLIVHKCINKSHVQAAFDLGTASAHRVIQKFKQNNPRTFYDLESKTRKPCDDFKPMFLDIDANEFLNAAQIMTDELII